jgi:chromatin assembly factor 1 subunit B
MIVFHNVAGECVCELYDHKDWVQGVAWDPLNKFIATQSKDRTMNIYSIETSTPKDPRDAIVSCKLLSKNIKLHVELPLTAQNGQPTSTTAASSSSHLMYGDEETTPFFRRLAFSPDGAILVSPAGIYDSAKLSRKPDSASSEVAAVTEAPISADKDKEKEKKDKKSTKKAGPGPTSFLFARGQLANESPFAHLPGHRTASVVVKFNPVLWELRKPSVEGKGKGKEREAPEADRMEVDGQENRESAVLDIAGSGEATSAIKLSQRNIYAVATHDTILIYDTQQTAPIAFFSSLHFAAFTDLAWWVLFHFVCGR